MFRWFATKWQKEKVEEKPIHELDLEIGKLKILIKRNEKGGILVCGGDPVLVTYDGVELKSLTGIDLQLRVGEIVKCTMTQLVEG